MTVGRENSARVDEGLIQIFSLNEVINLFSVFICTMMEFQVRVSIFSLLIFANVKSGAILKPNDLMANI